MIRFNLELELFIFSCVKKSKQVYARLEVAFLCTRNRDYRDLELSNRWMVVLSFDFLHNHWRLRGCFWPPHLCFGFPRSDLSPSDPRPDRIQIDYLQAFPLHDTPHRPRFSLHLPRNSSVFDDVGCRRCPFPRPHLRDHLRRRRGCGGRGGFQVVDEAGKDSQAAHHELTPSRSVIIN